VPGIRSVKHPEGRTYKFASPDAKTGLFLAALADLGIKASAGGDIGAQAARLELDDDQERDLMRDVMGSTLDEMLADGVSWVRIQRLNKLLFVQFAMGEEMAAQVLKVSGEAPAPANRAARRAATKKVATLVKSVTPRASRAGSTTRKKAAAKA
jgi:hypothetical protein